MNTHRSAWGTSGLFALSATILALGVTPARAAFSSDWPSVNNRLEADRFAAQSEITPENVRRLVPLCVYDFGRATSFQTGPIVVDGIVYLTTDFDTVALDADTCAVKWRTTEAYKPAGPLQVNRGAAFANGRVFRGTQDGRVLAYDATTGKRIWATTIANASMGETVPAALLTWHGLVFAGNAGGDIKGVKGRMYALDEKTGAIRWEQYLIPREDTDVARGPAAPAIASVGWSNGPGRPISGGATWTSYSLDRATGILYVPGGNPAPDFAAHIRPGTNPYAGSIIALDAMTGAVRKTYPIVEHDFHDWDVSAAPAIINTSGGHRLLASAIKDGHLRGIERRTGAILYAVPITTIENASTPLTAREGVRFCPGSQGGTEWNGPSYSPATNLIYTGAVDWCTTVKLAPDAKIDAVAPGQAWSGNDDDHAPFGQQDLAGRWAGWVYASNADTGAVAWSYKTPAPILAGVTATLGGLVFTADMAGTVFAFDATSGAKLWSAGVGGAVGGGVISYAGKAGHQRIAVAAGMMSMIWPTPKSNARLIIYGLPR
jgi:alcohol dehydrogenase (cytochrome c)